MGWPAAPVLEAARELAGRPPAVVPSALFERLNEIEAQLVTSIAAEATSPAPAGDCVRALRRLRCEREQAELQREIDRLQESGGADNSEITVLWQKKRTLLEQIEALRRA